MRSNFLDVKATKRGFFTDVKVISACVVIPTSNISEIICDTSTETEIANKKSHDSFQVIQLSMIFAIFQGY